MEKEAAINILREVHDNALFSVRTALETLVPELRDSEDDKDEKIRKTLIKMVRDTIIDVFRYYKIDKELVLAWLEKHKYTEDDLDKAYKCADEVQYRRGYEDAKKRDCKAGEQKPVVSDDALREGITHFGITQYQIDNWLKKYVEVEKLEQKPADKIKQECHCNGVREPKESTGVLKQLINKEKYAWSEEDKAMLDKVIERLKYSPGGEEYADIYYWLIALKDRVQSQQEWSQSDIDMIDQFILCCKEEHDRLCNDKYGHQDIVSDLKRDCNKKWDWLESLKNRVVPQNRWKPSDEQMDALETAISSLQSTALESLYNELKKL